MKNIIFLFILLAGIGAVAVGIWRFSPYFTSTLSPDEVEQAVQEQYQGNIISVKRQNGAYEVMTELEQGTYQLQVDAEDGAVTGVTRVAENNTNNTEALPEEEAQESSGSGEDGEDRQAVLSEQEAVAAAREEVDGELDDVELETSGAGEPFYYIELEQNDDDEATVQVHGITGEVLSVTWDD